MSKWRVAHLVFFAVMSLVIVFCQVKIHPGSIFWPGLNAVVLGAIFISKLIRYRRAAGVRKA